MATEHERPESESGDDEIVLAIYFTDFFNVEPEVLETHGAFNVSLVNDLPLFIDPFLLFDSPKPEYRQLHDQIITYVKFLRDLSIQDAQLGRAQVDQWFRFPEVKENWLGFSRSGNHGSGLGADFAEALCRNLRRVFRDFGQENVSSGSHLEKLCLIENGVGRDHLSDFTTNLIKQYLLEYTQAFARQHIEPSLLGTFGINKVRFDFETHRWQRATYELPAFVGTYVLLTPRDILTKDEAWINRKDLLRDFQDIYPAVPNEQLRDQINRHFMSRLSEDPTAKEMREAAAATVEQFPAILDYYIKDKENRAREAHQISDLKVRETESRFIRNLRAFVDEHLAGTAFYKHELDDSYAESLRRVHFLKDVIEKNDGYRLFYTKGKPVKRELDLQILFRLAWCATVFDVNREVNNGRGPVDFKVSRGAFDSTLVEFKLASNSKLKQNLKGQVTVYEGANNTKKSIKVILYFDRFELIRVTQILEDLGIVNREDVVLIDARNDNKPSGSNA